VDDTPLLDLKPYFASTDAVPDASVGWHAGLKRG
jgi:tRNA (Thr-GGU) A37 N-methylase